MTVVKRRPARHLDLLLGIYAARSMFDRIGVAPTGSTDVSITFPSDEEEHLTIEWLERFTDDVCESGAGQ